MKQKIIDLILQQFVSMSAKVGHCIDERWILHKLVPKLNPKEQAEIDSAIGDLQADGLIDVDRRTGILALALTQKGFDTIY